MQTQFNSLQKTMMTKITSGGLVDANLYKEQINSLKSIRENFNLANTAQGGFTVSSMKLESAVEAMTTSLKKQDLTFGQMRGNLSTIKAAYKEQIALRNSYVTTWTDADGKLNADLFVPKDLPSRLSTLRTQMGFVNALFASGANNMIKWGKNIQWAGRQLTVGFTVPIVAVAVATGAMAEKINASLVQITKVYGDAGKTTSAQLAQVKADSMDTARAVAQSFGQSGQDTLAITAQLAAAGLQGNELQKSTIAVTKARMLGDLDLNDAIKTTITLQSAFHDSSSQLNDDFNYMNSIENSTVLTMQDFTKAIPVISGVLKAMGGNLQTITPLLVAFKAGGIDITNAANAIKTAIPRVMKPTAAAVKDFNQIAAGTGVTLKNIVENDGNDFVQMLKDIYAQMKRLTPQQQIAFTKDLFGLQQGSKLLAAMQQLSANTGQVAQAFAVTNQNAEDWANTASGEVIQQTQSLSGQFKRLTASIQLDLAGIGQTALKMAIPILRFVDDILKKFDSLPDSVKKFGLIAAIITAAIGPIVMMTGLMANMVGSIIKFGTALNNVFLRWRTLDKESATQQIIQKQATNAWDIQTAALTRYTMELQAAIEAMQGWQSQAARTAAQTKTANMMSMGLYPISPKDEKYISGPAGPTGSWMAASGMPAPAKYHPANKNGIGVVSGGGTTMTEESGAAAEIEKASEATRANWTRIGSKLPLVGIAAGAMGSMVGSSGSLLSNISNVVFAGSLLGSTKIGQKLGRSISGPFIAAGGMIAQKIGPVLAKNEGMFAKLATTGKTALTGIGAAAGPVGLTIAGVGLAALVVADQIHKSKEKSIADFNAEATSAKQWSNILGFAYRTAGASVNKASKSVTQINSAIDAFKKSAPQMAEAFQKMAASGSDQADKMSLAIREGIKVVTSGGSAADATNAAVAAMKMMGSQLSAEELTVQVKAALNFSDDKAVLNQQASNMVKDIQSAINNQMKQGHWESIERWFTGADENGKINATGQAALKSTADNMWNIFSESAAADQATVFKKLSTTADAPAQTLFDRLRTKYADSFQSAGVTSLDTFLKAVGGQSANKLMQNTSLGGLGLSASDAKDVAATSSALRELMTEFAKMAGLPDDLVAKVFDFDALRAGLGTLNGVGKATLTVTQAQEDYNTMLTNNSRINNKLSEAEKLSTLNILRAAAGLDAATSSAQGFSDVVQTQTEKIHGATSALGDYSAALVNIPDASTATSTLKGVYSGAMDNIFSAASDIASTQFQARSDAISAAATRQDSRFDALKKKSDARYAAQEKTINNSYKNRISKIDGEIKAEESADAKRQALFEAEKTRIQRMADLFAKNIDFQSALNSGALDDAAKIQNDIMATQMGWNADDASAQSKNASTAKVNKLTAQKTSLEKEQKARTDQLKAQAKAEDAALDRQKKAYDARVKYAQQAAEQEQKINQDMLNNQLAALQAYVPSNEKQLNAHIARIEAVYKKYGINLQAQGTGWGKIIGSALQDNVAIAAATLKSGIQWTQIGSTIADQMTRGAFNLTMSQFSKWISTGQLPSTGLANTKKTGDSRYTITSGPYKGKQINIGDSSHHAGGVVGQSGSRTGHSGAQDQSEVTINALKGEGVVNLKGMKTLGESGLHAINSGMGPAGMAGAYIAAMTKSAIQNSIINAGMAQMNNQISGTIGEAFSLPNVSGKSPVGAGKFGGYNLTSEQLSNAATIIRTGLKMGASSRDLVVSIMTAMQESTLRNLNYGDRDSLGLFQQRAGWGSVSERENPVYAASKFFQALLAIKGRNGMPLTAEAQAVQRSAFPDAYAKWQTMAEAVVAADLGKGLREGGKTMNTGLAKLHPDELVLTKPLTKQLEDGIGSMNDNRSTTNIFKFENYGNINGVDDLEKTLNSWWNKKQRKTGLERNIKNGRPTS